MVVVSSLRTPARVYVWSVIVAAGVLFVAEWQYGVWPKEPTEYFVLVGLVLVGTLAEILGISLHAGFLHNNKVLVTITTITNFSATLLFGPAAGGVAGVATYVLADIWARRAWYKTLFNASTVVIVINLVWFTFNLVNDGSTLPLSSLQNALAIVLAALAYELSNSLLVCAVVALAEGCRVWEVWRASFKDIYGQLLSLFPIGTLLIIVYHQNVWGLFLLLVPVYLAQYSFQAYRTLKTQSQRTMEMLARAVDQRDPYTYHHSERVAEFGERIAQKLRLDVTEVESIKAAALVHDLGKVGIESSILLKPGPLDPQERRRMQEHPTIGADIVGQLTIYEQMRDLVACHQERWDGRGYPRGLKGEESPLGARIIAAADAYDAMTSDRPYRKALSPQVAQGELLRGRGTQFDPRVVDAFLEVLQTEQAEERPLLRIEPLAEKQAVS